MKRAVLLSTIFALLSCLVPLQALANSMAPATFTFLSGPPQQVIPEIIGVSALIVFIEAFVFLKMLAVNFWRAVWISFVANLLSSIFGLIVLALPFLLVPIGIVCAVYCYSNRKRIPVWVTSVIIITLLATPLFILLGFLNTGSMDMFYFIQAFLFPVSVLSAFGLSVLVEGDTVRKFLGRDDIWKAVFVGNVLTYILLICITANSYVPAGSRGVRYAWISRAKGTLRSIGSSELAYQATNEKKQYGSFDALKESLYIASGYTRGNMIENFSLSWYVTNISTVSSEQNPYGMISTFTIVAWPRDTRPGYLNTFCVTEDQTVRVYNPKQGNRLENVHTWDPIF